MYSCISWLFSFHCGTLFFFSHSQTVGVNFGHSHSFKMHQSPSTSVLHLHRCCLFCLIRPEDCASSTSPSLSQQFCCTLSGQLAPLLFLIVRVFWWHHTKTALLNSKTHLCLQFSEEQSLLSPKHFDTRDNLTMMVIFSPNDHDLFLTLTRSFSRLNFA